MSQTASRVVLLLPGLVYSAQRPLLHFAGAVFAKHGWAVREVQWSEAPPHRDGQDLPAWFARQRAFVQEQVGRILDGAGAARVALAGKSLGAFAAGLAADRGLPGVWLTPVLRDSPVPGDLRRASAPFLLVGSTADPAWEPGIARSFGRPVFEAADADHSMEIAGEPVRSAELLVRITAAVDDFVAHL
ncbi:hypothetical protein [Actinoplanes sp. N902-109]|uniref:hypothetical protein n=1 Tax=Actinoplanes sp. (strain N902-109) TaxID=649831 RepID=UPI0005A28D39|nr:hypothetical protein [Actinoplanes sp. N902-109]